MKQTTFASMSFNAKKRRTRREKSLPGMDQAVPWSKLVALIEPRYPKVGRRGRPPMPLESMLRIYFMLQVACALRLGYGGRATRWLGAYGFDDPRQCLGCELTAVPATQDDRVAFGDKDYVDNTLKRAARKAGVYWGVPLKASSRRKLTGRVTDATPAVQ